MEEHLWVIEYRGNGDIHPAPEFDEDKVIVADTDFTVVAGDMAQVEAVLRDTGNPRWRLRGHPADGRWIGAGGDEVYIVNCRVYKNEREAWDALGLKPQDFGGETWQDVDDDVVRATVRSFFRSF